MTSRVCSLFAAFWMCCTGTAPVCAQTGKTSFDFNSHPSSRHYTMNDGLPETGVNWVMQDSRGFIWLATYAGLCKFDGYKFTTYKRNPESANTLGNNVVNTLWEDHLGRLWVGHDSGLDLFDPQTEKFHSTGPNWDLKKAVWKFRVRKDGKLWICTQGGVYIADTETLSIERMRSLPDDGYWDIAEARDGSVWVAAGESGLVHIDGKTGQTSVYRHDSKDPTSLGNISLSIFIDEQEKVWVGGWGLSLFDAKSKSFTHFLTDNQVRYVLGNSDNR